jgi:phosphotransferase system HPr (HPr) family protein
LEGTLPQVEISIEHPIGLHARPAAVFVRLASSFPAAVTICKINSGAKPVNAKSILAVLSLGVNQGDRIALDAEGVRAEEALAALIELVRSNFGDGHSSTDR